MIDFDMAISVAYENVTKLVKGAKNLVLEGVLISSDNKLYEVTYSYDLERQDELGLPKGRATKTSNLMVLASLMGKRREYKVFLVDSNSGQFRGFKNYKEE